MAASQAGEMAPDFELPTVDGEAAAQGFKPQ